MSSDPRYTLFAARAVFDERLTAMDVRVLAALGTFTDRQGWCHPSQTTIAKRIKSSRTRVNGCIKALVDAGYVQAVQQASEKRGREVSLYRVLLDFSAPEAVDAAVHELDIKHEKIVGTPVSPVDRGVSAPETPPVEMRDRPCLPGETPPVSPVDIELTPLEHSHKKGARLLASWTPRNEEIRFGVDSGLTEAEVHGSAEHFRDHFLASTTSSARKLDWDRAFKNWLRTAASDAKRGRRPVPARASTASETDWPAFIAHFEATGSWPSSLGPKPNEPGYRGPPISEPDLFQAQGAKR